MKSKCTCPDPKDAWPWITWHCNEEVDRCQGGLLHHPKQKEEPSHEAIIRCEKECGKLINVLIALIRRKFGLDFTLKRIAQQMIHLEDIVTLAQRILTKIAVTKM